MTTLSLIRLFVARPTFTEAITNGTTDATHKNNTDNVFFNSILNRTVGSIITEFNNTLDSNVTTGGDGSDVLWGESSDEDDGSSMSRGGGAPSSDGGGSGQDFYEFMAFVCWYIFLIMCCIIPTACAYRRRKRSQRLRAAAQLDGAGEEVEGPDGGVILLRAVTSNGRPFTIVASRRAGSSFSTGQEEQLKKEKRERLEEAIKETTMTVSELDLKNRSESGGVHDIETCVHSNIGARTESVPQEGDKGADSSLQSNNLDAHDEDGESEFASVTLPAQSDSYNETVSNCGLRQVPNACAICLSAYEVGTSITWSPNSLCQHAFHEDCIMTWLMKKDEPLCPCCRQEFIPLSSLTAVGQHGEEANVGLTVSL